MKKENMLCELYKKYVTEADDNSTPSEEVIVKILKRDFKKNNLDFKVVWKTAGYYIVHIIHKGDIDLSLSELTSIFNSSDLSRYTPVLIGAQKEGVVVFTLIRKK